jgi:TPR repeat protein
MAIPWLERIAEEGDASAMYLLGFTYEGYADIPKAIEWYEKAVAHGDTDSIESLEKLKLRK